MIQTAHCGIGIVGKEGRQASLAADFSVSQFKNVGPLLLVHGRNSYKRSASLSQFVIHRGLLISVMQVARHALRECLRLDFVVVVVVFRQFFLQFSTSPQFQYIKACSWWGEYDCAFQVIWSRLVGTVCDCRQRYQFQIDVKTTSSRKLKSEKYSKSS